MGVISGGYRFLTGVRAVFVVLSGKCGKSGVDSLVWDFHYILTRGVGWMWWAESMDITRFFDSAIVFIRNLLRPFFDARKIPAFI